MNDYVCPEGQHQWNPCTRVEKTVCLKCCTVIPGSVAFDPPICGRPAAPGSPFTCTLDLGHEGDCRGTRE